MNTFTRRATTAVAALALAATGALVAVAPAQATTPATATFTSVKVSGLKSKYTLTSKAKQYSFKVNITGTAADSGVSTDNNGDGLNILYKPYDSDSSGPKIKKIASKVKNPTLPSISSHPRDLRTGANTYKLSVSQYTSPGVYEIQIPVTQQNWTTWPRTNVTKIVKKRVTINANPKLTRAATSYYASSWRIGKTASITFRAPAYQSGAKVTLYYKKAGTKKYSKIVTKKLAVKKGDYQASTVLKTKKLTKSGHVYFKVTNVKYAKGYKTKPAKITVSKR